MAAPSPTPTTTTLSARETSLRPALALAGIVLLARILYSVLLCPYNLVEDEAHYWLWAHHLDWSYYSKGPGIAWVIAFSTHFFGQAEWAVRLPTLVASSIGALAVAGLARDIARRAHTPISASPSRVAFFAAAAFLLAPAFQLTGILITIDGCYLACWALACWAAWRALMERSLAAWPALGAAVALGFLFKYTILLLPPGFMLFALWNRRGGLNLHPRFRTGLVACVLLALLGLAPVLIWNAREGWPTLRHLIGHLGLKGGDMPVDTTPGKGWAYEPLWTINYLLAPLGMIGPAVILAVLAMRRRLRPAHASANAATTTGTRFLVACAAPLFIFYFLISFIAEPEQNWAIASFVSLLALAAWFAADELRRRRLGASQPELTAPGTPRTRPAKLLWRLSLYYGLAAAPLLLRADITARTLTAITAAPPGLSIFRAITGRDPRPITIGRLIGSREMTTHIAELLADLKTRTPGAAPFIMAAHYGRASQIAYYLARDSNPALVLSPQSIMGGRRSQFDLWPETRLTRPDLIGQPAILLSNNETYTLQRWQDLFDRVEPLATPDHKLRGEHKKDRVAYIGYGYKGPHDPRH